MKGPNCCDQLRGTPPPILKIPSRFCFNRVSAKYSRSRKGSNRSLEYFAETLLNQKRLGIFTIGGGVPRNWSQQFGPFIELRHRRMGEDVPLKRYHYGLRICPEPVYWGGLSGSPYSEAVSWGKFVPPAEGGKFGEVFVDATVGLPLIVAAVLERLDKDKDKGASVSAKKEKKVLAKR